MLLGKVWRFETGLVNAGDLLQVLQLYPTHLQVL